MYSGHAVHTRHTRHHARRRGGWDCPNKGGTESQGDHPQYHLDGPPTTVHFSRPKGREQQCSVVRSRGGLQTGARPHDPTENLSEPIGTTARRQRHLCHQPSWISLCRAVARHKFWVSSGLPFLPLQRIALQWCVVSPRTTGPQCQ